MSEQVLNFLGLLLTPIVYPICIVLYSTMELAQEISKIPEYLDNYAENQNLRNKAPRYLDIETFTKLYDNYSILKSEYDKYKRYIYSIHDNKMVKANLLVDKFSHKFAYVIFDNDKFIVVEKDIEKYKIKKM